jgi:hypothetical protein
LQTLCTFLGALSIIISSLKVLWRKYLPVVELYIQIENEGFFKVYKCVNC